MIWLRLCLPVGAVTRLCPRHSQHLCGLGGPWGGASAPWVVVCRGQPGPGTHSSPASPSSVPVGLLCPLCPCPGPNRAPGIFIFIFHWKIISIAIPSVALPASDLKAPSPLRFVFPERRPPGIPVSLSRWSSEPPSLDLVAPFSFLGHGTAWKEGACPLGLPARPGPRSQVCEHLLGCLAGHCGALSTFIFLGSFGWWVWVGWGRVRKRDQVQPACVLYSSTQAGTVMELGRSGDQGRGSRGMRPEPMSGGRFSAASPVSFMFKCPHRCL